MQKTHRADCKACTACTARRFWPFGAYPGASTHYTSMPGKGNPWLGTFRRDLAPTSHTRKDHTSKIWLTNFAREPCKCCSRGHERRAGSAWSPRDRPPPPLNYQHRHPSTDTPHSRTVQFQQTIPVPTFGGAKVAHPPTAKCCLGTCCTSAVDN